MVATIPNPLVWTTSDNINSGHRDLFGNVVIAVVFCTAVSHNKETAAFISFVYKQNEILFAYVIYRYIQNLLLGLRTYYIFISLFSIP